MTFTGRLRITLILAAVVPTMLVAIIVVAGTAFQVKRIEQREAEAGMKRFSGLIDDAVARTRQNLEYIADSQPFRIMELGLGSRQTPDPMYRLPILSLDFVEFVSADGTILISANRPAMVGQSIDSYDSTLIGQGETARMFRFENDIDGRHPATAIVLATEAGYLIGGFYLDGEFMRMASELLRADISAIAKAEIEDPYAIPAPGSLYYGDGNLLGMLFDAKDSEYFLQAVFHPVSRMELFSDFFTAVAAVIIFSLAVVIPIGLYFTAQTRKKIAALTDGAGRVADGNFEQPVSGVDAGEFGDLADALNHMMRELNEYRERLIVSQKIAAWQTIGRKVAHEVKNPLTPIAIAADDLRLSYSEHREDFAAILESSTATIKSEVNRLKKLIDRFAAFARMPAPQIGEIETEAFISEISVLFKEDISNGRLHITSELAAAKIRADADQLRQICINLIKNSLETNCRRCIIHFIDSDDSVNILIEDDGPGFPDKIISEGIIPYYSTKKDGSGLGLLICQRIAFDHNGTMTITNKPEGGGLVTIRLPQTNA